MAESYKVLSQVQDIEINPAGTGFMDVWKISYRVTSGPASGTIATVTVPNEDHTAEGVSAAIAAKVAQLSAVAKLGGLCHADMAN